VDGVDFFEGFHPRAEGGEEAEGVAEALLAVLDVEAAEGGVGGLEEEEAEAGFGGGGELGLAAGEFGGEVGIIAPVVQGVAVDAEDLGDGGDGSAGGK
jgi:hypothetical protein